MPWPFGNRKGKASAGFDATRQTYRALKSYLGNDRQRMPVIPDIHLSGKSVALFGFSLRETSATDVLKSLAHTWDVLRPRSLTLMEPDCYRECETTLAYVPSSIRPMLFSTHTYTPGYVEKVGIEETRPDDVIAIWPSLEQGPNGNHELTFMATAFGYNGSFKLSEEYIENSLLALHLEVIWRDVYLNLRQITGKIPLGLGFFPASYSGPHAVPPLDDSDKFETFAWLISQHAVTFHEGEVLRYKVSGRSGTRFVLESTGNLTAGTQRQFHSGTMVVDLANLADVAAVRWVTDFGLQMAFTSPVPSTSTNYDLPSWQEKKSNDSKFEKLIQCQTFEGALALKYGLLALYRETMGAKRANGATSSSTISIPFAPSSEQESPFRTVEEKD